MRSLLLLARCGFDNVVVLDLYMLQYDNECMVYEDISEKLIRP